MAQQVDAIGGRIGALTQQLGDRTRRNRQDACQRDLKHDSVRLARRAARVAIDAEIAECLANGEASGAGTHWLACDPCLAHRAYESWLLEAREADKRGQSWGPTLRPVGPCMAHQFEEWMDAQYAQDDMWEDAEYLEWRQQQYEWARELEDVDQSTWWAA